MVVPAQNPLFVGVGGSRRELKNQSDKNIAFKVKTVSTASTILNCFRFASHPSHWFQLVFPPNSNFSAQAQFGMIPAFGKSTITLDRTVSPQILCIQATRKLTENASERKISGREDDSPVRGYG